MDLKKYASQSKYLNWNESEAYNIALSITLEEFYNLQPIVSDKFDSEQFEIPIYVIVGKDLDRSILATKSKILLNEFITFWDKSPDLILRVHKKGSGFYTKYTVTSTNNIYDKASGKFKKLPAKK